MKVTMLLCDSAQAIEGKLYILGGGWNVAGPGPTPMAIALHIEVPWDGANRRHPFELALLNADGHPIRVPSPPSGDLRPIQIAGNIEVGRPPGVTPGAPLPVVMALNIAAFPLSPNSQYLWRLSIDGETREDWQLSFFMRPAGAQPPQQ